VLLDDGEASHALRAETVTHLGGEHERARLVDRALDVGHVVAARGEPPAGAPATGPAPPLSKPPIGGEPPEPGPPPSFGTIFTSVQPAHAPHSNQAPSHRRIAQIIGDSR
jgi:hypothetical protein